MPTLSDEEQELIQKDRDANPGCFYSTALSQSCRSMNGDSKCEIVKKIFRQCPNARKELISKTSTGARRPPGSFSIASGWTRAKSTWWVQEGFTSSVLI